MSLNKYAVVVSGTVAHVAFCDSALGSNWVVAPPEVEIGYLYDEALTKFSAPEKPINEDTRITPLAFSNRFQFEEEVAIVEAGKVDSTVKVVLNKVDRSTYIDLASEQTKQLLQILVDKALLPQSRVDEILNNPIEDVERFVETINSIE